MSRPRALTPEQEAELEILLDCGVTRETAASVYGISVRTVARATARTRDKTPQTLDELLASLPSLDEVLALAPDRPSPTRARRRRRRPAWIEAAARADRLAAEAAEFHSGNQRN